MGHTEIQPEVPDKRVEERASHKTTTQKDIEQNPEFALPATPSHFAGYKAFTIFNLVYCIYLSTDICINHVHSVYIYISDQ